MPDTPIRNIYVAADALWDLRQGTLARINPDFAVAVTADPSYYVRDTDTFTAGGQTLQKDIYERVFEKYKHEILRCSLRTEILDFLVALCTQFLKPSVTQPTAEAFGVEVNSYPFELSPVEKQELLTRLSATLGNAFTVSVSHLSPQDLTLSYVKRNYLAMVLYNYYSWINLHTEELKKNPLMGVGLYGPRIFFSDKSAITEDLRRDLVKRGRDEFELLSEILQPFIGLQFLPISFFSAATPLNNPSLRQLIKTR
jgi:hypothetical protein